MKTKLLLTVTFSIVLLLFTLNSIQATITQDIFSDQVTRLEIEISNNQSIVNFYFNSSGYDWDKFSVNYPVDEYTNLTLNNLYLSDLLNSLTFKLEDALFTNLNIETPSILQAIVDNVLSMTSQDFSVSDLNNNLTLVNSFFKAETDFYQTFEKKGNNYIYTIDKGHEDVNVSEIVEESLQVFNISEILSDVGIDNIFELDFTTELKLDIPLENGEYILDLQVIDGQETYNKNIYLTLSGFESNETNETEEEVEEDDSDDDEPNRNKNIHLYNLKDGKNFRFKENQIVYFTLKEQHQLTITKLFTNRVFFKIQSEPVYFNLSLEEGKNICLSEEESIFVKLERIGEDYVDFYILENRDLSDCQNGEIKIITKQDVIEIGCEDCEEKKEEKKTKFLIKLMFGITFVLIFILVVFLLTRKKTDNEPLLFEKEEQEDEIEV